MAYLLEDNTKNIVSDIIQRKEFYQFKLEKKEKATKKKYDIIPRFFINKMITENNILQFSNYQQFVANYLNPNTPYSRILLKWETGVGKTIGSLSIAMNFIEYYKKEEIQQGNKYNNIGSIFIIGFTWAQFRNELLRFPEFGFINRVELEKLKLLKKNAYSGHNSDIILLKEYKAKLKKRLNNREGNGFFEFIGYKKLANMIFINNENVKITELSANEISSMIIDGKIVLNVQLLERFKNSLIICDEIHNTYNSLEKNNWGIAIQHILNYHQSIRAVFLSATIINNYPSEIIDLLNLLLPITYYPIALNKPDFFDSNKKLRHGAIDKIAELSKGRISYLRDVNPVYFPSKVFIGESIKDAPYLKFIRCPMTKDHYNAYKIASQNDILQMENQYVNDFSIPNPEDPSNDFFNINNIKKIEDAPNEWKIKNKIDLNNDNIIIGNILLAENLIRISNKYSIMLQTLINNIKIKAGKHFIYHNYIHMSGVLFIQEIIKKNNMIGEFDNSTDNTICSICGLIRKEHTSKQIIGGNSDSDIYNNSTKSFEIFKEDTKILEYKKIDNLVYIQHIYINFDVDTILIQNTINTLSEKNYVIISGVISSDLLNLKLKDILDNLKFKQFNNSNDLKTDSNLNKIYYGNQKFMELEKTDKIWYIDKIKDEKMRMKKKQIRGGDVDLKTHTFMPVRYIMAHSLLDKEKMNDSIERFNASDNSDGSRILILIGGKIIKESYDIKAIREVMIMSRPDNIPTLLQIIGRSIRKNSHIMLPFNERNVNIRLFTSCLPIKKNSVYELSNEEIKYIEKLKYYKIIQEIEKVLHINAIDADINRDIIWPEKPKHDELGALYFNNHKTKTFKLNELNLETFTSFYNDKEIDLLNIIIKRLFIEKSVVWLYKDLLDAVKNSNNIFELEINMTLISDDSFNIALNKLKYIDLPEKGNLQQSFITPIFNNTVNTFIDKLYDTNDKIIILPGGQKSVIKQIADYYILLPIDNIDNIPIMAVELQNRILIKKLPIVIDVKNFLETNNSISNYENKKTKFYNRWNNILIDDLEMAVCDFGLDFHISFIEECIEYIFNVWTDKTIKKSIMHEFYFKMIYYYDLRKLVVWGSTLKDFMFKKYENILAQVSVVITNKDYNQKELKELNASSSGLINLLKSSLNKSDSNWISSGLKKQFEENLKNSLELFNGNYKKPNKFKKINADIVPVGHFMSNIPKFYFKTGWIESPEYLETKKFTENNVIIGYDERSKTGVHMRFKIRNPIQIIKQYEDTRLIEKGSVCATKNKLFLIDTAKKLGVKSLSKINAINLCNEIRTRLIYLELKERMNNTKIKWYYFIYERRPETILN